MNDMSVSPETPNESSEMFDGDDFDDLYSLVYSLEQDGFTWSQILNALNPRMQHQVNQLKEKGYLGGNKNNTSGI
jgi:hypothetical protein